MRRGRLDQKHLRMEIALHRHLGKHQNIIQFLSDGENISWVWIAMELADGGDLFDKINPDKGVGEEIAHFYFFQLMNAVSYMHSKGIAHRDLKPENVLLSANGDLKIADFGLAALYEKDGHKRLCNTVCGSPPYMAPEVLDGRRSKRRDVLDVGYGYEPNKVDIWSCGVILFVLLVGNTPWDSPTKDSEEFMEYVESGGQKSNDGLWDLLPPEMLSLIRGMLRLEADSRYTLQDIKKHPWFQRRNSFLSSSGRSAHPVQLATSMLSQLRIDFSQPPDAGRASQRSQNYGPSQDGDVMDVDSSPRVDSSMQFDYPRRSSASSRHSPAADDDLETPLAETPFNWERPPLHTTNSEPSQFPQSQYTNATVLSQLPSSTQDILSQDPAMTQFSQTSLSQNQLLTLTQAALAFKDVLPATTLSRFISSMLISELIPRVVAALGTLGIPCSQPTLAQLEHWDVSGKAVVRVKTVDQRRQSLNGHIVLERLYLSGVDMTEVRFQKAVGDPLEWRRFFTKVIVLIGEKGVVRLDN